MSVVLERGQEQGIIRFRFTADQFERMAEAGILREDDRVELISGDLLRMSPIGKLHVWCVTRLNYLLIQRLGDRAVVLSQSPIRLNENSEPEPDLAVVRPYEHFYGEELPTPGDILLLVEVAETSQEYDRRIKVPLYAHAGIPEVWLVDLNTDTVTVYSRPLDGAYQQARTCRRGETIHSVTLPELTLAVEEIIGPASS
jgi:Uma2 family endonuclease